ncbi:hypothetical protein [Acidocella sp.]|uniref:hypothetical protein n=1 Tax=Acidocella sp. TaxID=50710 RepID=UPI003CFFFA29
MDPRELYRDFIFAHGHDAFCGDKVAVLAEGGERMRALSGARAYPVGGKCTRPAWHICAAAIREQAHVGIA